METCKISKKIVSWKIVEPLKVEAKDDRPQEIGCINAPKRPLELTCDIKKVKVQGEQWTIFVGLFNGKPYEVFGGLSKYLDLPNKYKTAKIIKNGKIDGIATYNIIVGEDDEAMTIRDIVNVFENKNYGSFTRLLSLSLRHGINIQYIVEQLSKDKHSEMTSFSKVVARVLKTYIKDGTVSSSEKACPNCKSTKSLVYQAGCISCTDCNYSRCS